MSLPYPEPTSDAVSKRMRRNRRRDSGPEIAVRRLVHRAGLRYRVDAPIRLRSRVVRPDLVFFGARLAVFIDGCFWHCCPVHGNTPRANVGYWAAKLERNVQRDRDVDAELEAAGWRVLRAWEHEAPDDVAGRIAWAIATPPDRGGSDGKGNA